MKRRSFNLLAAVLLVLCGVAAALWAVSYTGPVIVELGRSPAYGTVTFSDGTFCFNNQRRMLWIQQRNDSALSEYQQLTSMGKTPAPPQLQGIQACRIEFPMWLITAIPSAAALCIILSGRFSRDLGQARKCRAYGYDLRATPDRCPECGTAAKMSSPSQ